jgi:hypothetical protein
VRGGCASLFSLRTWSYQSSLWARLCKRGKGAAPDVQARPTVSGMEYGCLGSARALSGFLPARCRRRLLLPAGDKGELVVCGSTHNLSYHQSLASSRPGVAHGA